MTIQEKIAQATKLPKHKKHIKSLGEDIFIEEISIGNLREVQQKNQDSIAMSAEWFYLTFYDADGNKVFKSKDEILSLPKPLFDDLAIACGEVNNQTVQDDEEKN